MASAVRSAMLVRQLVPLEEIRFSVLKPRSDNQPYQGSDYRPWDDLVNWSEGQRYAARFSVFVVLMAFIRQRRNPKQKTSVIIADNPFGGASSGHILEIVMTVARKPGPSSFVSQPTGRPKSCASFPCYTVLCPGQLWEANGTWQFGMKVQR